MSQQINLFNPIFRKQKKYFSSVTMLQALGLICLACALLAADAAVRERALRAQAGATDARLLQRQQRLAAAKIQFPARQKSPTLASEVAAAQAELAMFADASAMIGRGGFGDVRGFSPYFRAFARQSVDGLWLTGLNISANGAQIGVRGNTLRAELVPQYMRRLSSETIMQGKTFSSLDISAPPPVVQAAGGAAPAAALPTVLKFSLQSAGGGAK